MGDAASQALRRAAADRLAELACSGSLTSEHVRLSAETLGVSERTVWRWLRARRTGHDGAPPRRGFVIDNALRVRLAHWRGNVMALHRKLVAEVKSGGVAGLCLQGCVRPSRWW